MSTAGKRTPELRTAPDPTFIVVEQTTSAVLIIRCSSIFRCSRDIPLSGPGGMNRFKSSRTASARPRRIARTPNRIKPSKRLSTAMFESEQASRGSFGYARATNHAWRMVRATLVLPVPGGPCTKVSERLVAASTARHWLLFRPAVTVAVAARTASDAKTIGAAISSTSSSSPSSP